MGRFYKTAKPEYVDFASRLPEELMMGVIETADEQVKAKEDAALSLYDQLKLDSLTPDTGRAREIVSGYEEQIDDLTRQIQEDPKAFRRNATPIKKLARNIHTDFTRGEAASIQSQYNTRQAFAKKVDDLVKKDPDKFRGQDRESLLNYLDKQYKGVNWDTETLAGNAYLTEDLVQYADQNAIAETAAKGIKEEMVNTYGAYLSKDGNWVYKSKNELKFVPEKDVEEIVQRTLNSDSNLNDFVDQQIKVGAMTPEEAYANQRSITDAMMTKYGFTQTGKGQTSMLASPFAKLKYAHDLEKEDEKVKVDMTQGKVSINPYGGKNKLTRHNNNKVILKTKADIARLDKAIPNATGEAKSALIDERNRLEAQRTNAKAVNKKSYEDAFETLGADQEQQKWYWKYKYGDAKKMQAQLDKEAADRAEHTGQSTSVDRTKIENEILANDERYKDLQKYYSFEEAMLIHRDKFFKRGSEETQYDFNTVNLATTVDGEEGKVKRKFSVVNKDGEITTTETTETVDPKHIRTTEFIKNTIYDGLQNSMNTGGGFTILNQKGENTGNTEKFGDGKYALTFSGGDNEKNIWGYLKDKGLKLKDVMDVESLMQAQYGFKPGSQIRFKNLEGVDSNKQYILQMPTTTSNDVARNIEEVLTSEELEFSPTDEKAMKAIPNNWLNAGKNTIMSNLTNAFQDVTVAPGTAGIPKQVYIVNPKTNEGNNFTVTPIGKSTNNPNDPQKVLYRVTIPNAEGEDYTEDFPDFQSIADAFYTN